MVKYCLNIVGSKTSSLLKTFTQGLSLISVVRLGAVGGTVYALNEVGAFGDVQQVSARDI